MFYLDFDLQSTCNVFKRRLLRRRRFYREVKLSVYLLGISACVADNNNNKQMIVIAVVWATQPETPSKQTLSLTFLLYFLLTKPTDIGLSICLYHTPQPHSVTPLIQSGTFKRI